ncbi:glycosyl hydrolase family 18 protein [Natrinema sp. DC36]|uniref:glycosyl hydrolase family 18 protein n=1 Tax=Natrinema sp. DC36 TaxID=2878680 RepID=UPI001CF09D49|nr:glycosyl hydrolase family 18 protein [Natrinema sp. DC36]
MELNRSATIGITALLITSLFGGAAVSAATESGLTADFSVRDDTIETGERVGFMAEPETTNTWVTDLEWSFDDGATKRGWWQTHRFSEPGNHTISLTVTDNTGATDTTTVTVVVSGPGDETNTDSGTNSDTDSTAETDNETALESEYETWDETEVYRHGDRVVWNEQIWEAQWWSQGDTPDNARVWERVSDPGANDTETVDETSDTDRSQDGTETDGTDESSDTNDTDQTDETDTQTDTSGEQPNRTETGESSEDMRIVGYYTSWSVYDRNYTPSDVPLDKVTHMNYAFMDVEADGTVSYGDASADPQNLAEFRDLKAQHPNTTMQLSIGGWSLSTHFSDAAATQENRERFAETSVDLMQKYDFDGVDIDWEYPDGGGAADNSERPDDPENYVLLLEAVRQELDAAEQADGREYELSIAGATDPHKTAALDVPGIAAQVDYVSVMNYDYTGTWDSQTNHNSKLFSASDDPSPDRFNAAAGMQGWVDEGMPKDKLVFGAAFFGWGFDGVPDQNNGLYQSFDGAADVGWSESGATDYQYVSELLESDSSYEQYWDDEAKVPYVYSARDNVFITYENPKSIANKVEYVVENGYGGMMFWEFYGDREEVLIDEISNTLNDR